MRMRAPIQRPFSFMTCDNKNRRKASHVFVSIFRKVFCSVLRSSSWKLVSTGGERRFLLSWRRLLLFNRFQRWALLGHWSTCGSLEPGLPQFMFGSSRGVTMETALRMNGSWGALCSEIADLRISRTCFLSSWKHNVVGPYQNHAEKVRYGRALCKMGLPNPRNNP